MSLIDSSEQQESSAQTTQSNLTDATGNPDSPPQNLGDATTAQGDWYYDKDIKGNGDKPEWLKEKYATLADQAKAYVELEKRLGAFKGAPEKYELTIKEHPDLQFRADDPMISSFLNKAKENNVSQDFMEELLFLHAQALTANVPNVEKELERLGPNARQEVQQLSQWASNHFTTEEFGVFKNLLNTADAVRLFEKIRKVSIQSSIAPPADNNQMHESEDQVRRLVHDPRYDKDPVFRQEVAARMAAAMKTPKGN